MPLIICSSRFQKEVSSSPMKYAIGCFIDNGTQKYYEITTNHYSASKNLFSLISQIEISFLHFLLQHKKWNYFQKKK